MATHHVRQSSHHSKRPQTSHTRSTRPAPLSKRTHSHGSKGSLKNAHHKDAESEDEDSMAVSFLNFCTLCEKQIITPSNSVLYCSESCRKKDTEKSFAYSYDHYSPPTTPFTSFSFEDLHFRDIVPQRSPTQPESKRSSIAFSDISSDDNMHSSDEKSLRSDSDASHYLRQFHSTTYSTETIRPRRPNYKRGSTSQISATPSLSHTPASSVSYSLPYTPAVSTRPLPSRTPNGSSYGTKSIDLVTPLTAPSSPKQYPYKSPAVSRTSTSTIEGEIVYAKSPVPTITDFASGSLGLLLSATPRA